MELRPLEHVEVFHVDQARYRFESARGEAAALLVDYSGNTFAIESDAGDVSFLDEIEKIARGLLTRKHAVNLAKKDHYLVDR